MRWGLAQLAEHSQAIMDPADRIKLAERDLLSTLDGEANRIIARAARRVSASQTARFIEEVIARFSCAQSVRSQPCAKRRSSSSSMYCKGWSDAV